MAAIFLGQEELIIHGMVTEPTEAEQPEPEPDMGDVPTVSRYVGQSSGEEEISLDDLLDDETDRTLAFAYAAG